MISDEKTAELREILEKTQNPLFLFDNDVDGLASFLLLARFVGKGKGVAIKSFPDLSATYVRKLHEFKPDYVFVLDKPLIEQGFIESARQLGMPIIWIDHHPPPSYVGEEGIHYFNPLQTREGAEEPGAEPSAEPTSYLCYKATRKREDEWIAMIGCLADWFIPEFAQDFSKENPDIFLYTDNPARALYETELGRIIKMLAFALLDRTTMVVRMLKNLLKIKEPRELLDISPKTASIHRRYRQINQRYEKILYKARQISKEYSKKLIFFQYGGDLSLSSELSNELFYLNPERVVVVAYIKGSKANVSVRGNVDVREITTKALEEIESTCGGHKHACGATLNVEDLPKFRDNILKLLKNL